MSRFLRGREWGGCLALILVLVSTAAEASTNRFSVVPQFAVQKWDWIFSPCSPSLNKNEWEFSQVLDYGYRPLEMIVNNQRFSGVVDHLLVQQWGVGYGIADRLSVEAFLPVVWWNRFTPTATGSAASNRTKIGDLGLQARYRFWETPFGLAVVPFLSVPTGSDGTYVGDTNPTGGFRIAADRSFGRFSFGLDVGARFREKVVFQDLTTSPQFLAGAAGSVRIVDRLFASVEVSSATDFASFYQNQISSPTQLLVALNRSFDKAGLDVGVGGGVALVRGFGTPLFHNFVALSWTGKIKKKIKAPPEVPPVPEVPNEWTVWFEENSTDLTADSKAQLDEAAAAYRSIRPDSILLEGDAYGRRTNQFTRPLFEKRIENITEYLVGKGVDRSRLETSPQSWDGERYLNYRSIIVVLKP